MCEMEIPACPDGTLHCVEVTAVKGQTNPTFGHLWETILLGSIFVEGGCASQGFKKRPPGWFGISLKQQKTCRIFLKYMFSISLVVGVA